MDGKEFCVLSLYARMHGPRMQANLASVKRLTNSWLPIFDAYFDVKRVARTNMPGFKTCAGRLALSVAVKYLLVKQFSLRRSMKR